MIESLAAAMVEAAVEASTIMVAEATAVIKVAATQEMEMETAVVTVAVESRVWDIEGDATKKPEIENEEQPEIAAKTVAAAKAEDAAVAGDAEGAKNGAEIGAQSKVFDPGKF